jgi:NAD(P)-dependent dehydrogenase (short-subunit alcohol dehydrogenase family)
LAPHRIRVNSIHPTGVNTTMGNQSGGGLTERIANDFTVGSIFMNSLPVELVEPEDISNAVLFLASDEARYVTGLTMTVDAGSTAR